MKFLICQVQFFYLKNLNILFTYSSNRHLAMKDLPNFLSGIVRLWGLHLYREDLYRRTLSMHNLGSLRRVCSQGYSSSLLYKKEIQWIFDSSKCTLEDGDIHQYQNGKPLPSSELSVEDKPFLLNKILEIESKTIALYQALLAQANLSYDATSILSDHLAKLNDIKSKLYLEINSDIPTVHFPLPELSKIPDTLLHAVA